jgi:hypothetical protein
MSPVNPGAKGSSFQPLGLPAKKVLLPGNTFFFCINQQLAAKISLGNGWVMAG